MKTNQLLLPLLMLSLGLIVFATDKPTLKPRFQMALVACRTGADVKHETIAFEPAGKGLDFITPIRRETFWVDGKQPFKLWVFDVELGPVYIIEESTDGGKTFTQYGFPNESLERIGSAADFPWIRVEDTTGTNLYRLTLKDAP